MILLLSKQRLGYYRMFYVRINRRRVIAGIPDNDFRVRTGGATTRRVRRVIGPGLGGIPPDTAIYRRIS